MPELPVQSFTGSPYLVFAQNMVSRDHEPSGPEMKHGSRGLIDRLHQLQRQTGDPAQRRVALAVRLGERLWRDGFRYSKTGVMISELLHAMSRRFPGETCKRCRRK